MYYLHVLDLKPDIVIPDSEMVMVTGGYPVLSQMRLIWQKTVLPTQDNLCLGILYQNGIELLIFVYLQCVISFYPEDVPFPMNLHE